MSTYFYHYRQFKSSRPEILSRDDKIQETVWNMNYF